MRSPGGSHRAAFLLVLATAVFSLPLLASPPEAEEIIRRAARSQRVAEERLASYTFDQVEVLTDFDSRGLSKKTERRLYYYFSSETPGEGTRELVEVDGRRATEEEKKDAAEADAKRRKSRGTERASGEASRPQSVKGEEEDPLVGPRRLSDLLARYDFRVSGEEILDGRPNHVIDFSPRAGISASKLSDRALNSLGGTVWIDASDYQIRKIEARLVSPLKIGGGILANLRSAEIVYEASPVRAGSWFPCLVEFRFTGKTGVFFRLDRSQRFEFSNFRSFGVETETHAGTPEAGSP